MEQKRFSEFDWIFVYVHDHFELKKNPIFF